MPPDPSPPPGRRTLLRATFAGGVLALGGCGIRLEDDAPALPLLPTRTPVPGEDLLTALTRECSRLADLASALPGSLATDLATLHRRQHTVLRTTLLREQVPAALLDGPAATPTGAAPDADALAALEAASARGAAGFAEVSAGLLAPVAAVHAQRYAAAWLLAGTAPDTPVAVVPGEPALDVAAALAGAVYLLEVAAARSSGTQRTRATTSRDRLRALRAEVLTGEDPQPPALGYSLPFPVRSAADARRLARETVSTLRDGLGAQLDPVLAEAGADGLSAVTRWLGTVEVEARRWGLPLAPFPGLA
ncbi:DUF4439 domain-containing protein [uncultured Phycicoccus sp.]|uniref:DUF4439 domain-containing protein n=1 Tax=uncultured Phycicoccus sp. TaxID=661422 RepID=UPI00261FC09C|nr:DUF4439 domain-containing protein [uncultured Phycicoccus sp.]